MKYPKGNIGNLLKFVKQILRGEKILEKSIIINGLQSDTEPLRAEVREMAFPAGWRGAG